MYVAELYSSQNTKVNSPNFNIFGQILDCTESQLTVIALEYHMTNENAPRRAPRCKTT